MAVITNKTRGKALAADAKLCKSAFSRAIGLMFSKKRALLFIFSKEKIIPLHMLMVFFPIDVVFVGKNRNIVEIKENFRPFSFYTPRKKALYIIEAPAGMVKRTGTKIGDKLAFDNI